MERPSEPTPPDDARVDETQGQDEERENPAVEDEVDEASDNSFPASDPPAY